MSTVARLLLCAPNKSSGKTTIALGLCAALRRRGIVVQPFKKGPDYIDPMWLTQASGRGCRNLDPYLMEWDEIRRLVLRTAAGACISIIEGNHGLHDGMALDGADSNAALAHALDVPVILVIDAHGMGRGIVPVLLGQRAFDPRVRIAGVILNNVGGPAHAARLRSALEHYTGVPVLGAVARDPALQIAERHLGLMPSNESGAAASSTVDRIATLLAAQVDLGHIVAIANTASPLDAPPPQATLASHSRRTAVRIGIARDRAFGFYYADDLEAMRTAGAQMVPFDTLRDEALPEVDAIFIGGGFPECLSRELEANTGMRAAVRVAIGSGMPAYAECGGLMYLARSLTSATCTARMAGVIDADVVMHPKPVGRGYVTFRESRSMPWPSWGATPGTTLRGHEFHYSSLDVGRRTRFALRLQRGHGVNGLRDGIVHRNLIASYVHRRNVGGDRWAERFVAFVRAVQRARELGVAVREAPRSVTVAHARARASAVSSPTLAGRTS